MEEWRSIPGYPGYEASSEGRIRSFRSGECKIIKQHSSQKGYLRANLKHENGKSHCSSAHRFIAMAFIPNPDNLPEVNHKNGNKTDNRPENLEWVTSSQNHKHAYDVLGKQSGAKGKHFDRRAKFTPTEVRIIRQTSLGLSELADYFGVDQSTIFLIRKGRTYKYVH